MSVRAVVVVVLALVSGLMWLLLLAGAHALGLSGLEQAALAGLVVAIAVLLLAA